MEVGSSNSSHHCWLNINLGYWRDGECGGLRVQGQVAVNKDQEPQCKHLRAWG